MMNKWKNLLYGACAALSLCVSATDQLPMLIIPQDVYTFNILPEHSGKLYIPEGYPCPLKFSPSSKWEGMNEIVLEVTLPEDLKASLFAVVQNSSDIREIKAEIRKVPGGTVYSYTLNNRTWKRRAEHALYIEGKCAKKGEQIRLDFLADGKKAASHIYQVEMVALPKGELPKDFKMFTYYGRAIELPNAALAERNAAYVEQLGIKGLLSPRQLAQKECLDTFRMLERRNWWIGRQVGHENMDALGMPYSAAVAALDEDGHPLEKDSLDFLVKYCPQYLTEAFGKLAGTQEISYGHIRCNGLYLDLEIYCHNRMLGFCKCSRCLKAFSNYTKIPLTEFTAKNIEKKYPEQWLAFREKQQAEMVRNYVGSFKVPDKTNEFVFNSFFESKENSFAIVKNKHYEPFTEYIMPMAYIRGVKIFDVIDYNVKSTRGKFLPMIYSVAGHCAPDWNTPDEVGLDLVVAAACGSKGAAFYCDIDFDGLYAEKMRRALDVIAKSEDFNIRGIRCENAVKAINNAPRRMLEVDNKVIPAATETLDNFRYTACTLNGEYLVSLFNFDATRKCQVKISLPQLKNEKYMVTDLASGNRFFMNGSATFSADQLKRGLPMTVAARNYSVILVQNTSCKAAGKPAGKPWIFQDEQSKTGDEVMEKRLAGNGMSISRTDRRHNGQYTVKLESPYLIAWVNLSDNGKIEQLFSKEAQKDLLCEPGAGLFREMFDEPFAMKIDAPYEVTDRKLSADFAEVELRARITHGHLKDFEVVKRYTIFRNAPKIMVSYKVTVNRTVKAQADFRMRVQNQPNLGATEKDLTDFLKFIAVCNGKKLEFSGKQHLAFGYADGMFKGYLGRTIKGMFDRPELLVSSPSLTLKFTAGPETTQFFSWRANIPTAEIFFRKTDFNPDPHRTKVWETELSCELIQ